MRTIRYVRNYVFKAWSLFKFDVKVMSIYVKNTDLTWQLCHLDIIRNEMIHSFTSFTFVWLASSFSLLFPTRDLWIFCSFYQTKIFRWHFHLSSFCFLERGRRIGPSISVTAWCDLWPFVYDLKSYLIVHFRTFCLDEEKKF